MPVLSFEKDLMVMKTGRVAIGYVFDGVEMEKWSANDYTTAGQIFDASFKSLPKFSIVQKIDIYYNDYLSKEKDLDYFESKTVDHFLGRPILKHKSYFFIISPADNNAKPNEVNNSFASFDKIKTTSTLKNIESRLIEWQKTVPAYIQELGSIGDVKLTRLNTEELKEVYRQMLNMEFRFDPGLPYKALENKENYLVIGDKKINVLSMTEQSKIIEYSRQCDYGVVSPFTYNVGIHMQFPHIGITSYYIDDTDKELERLDRERKLNFAATQFGGEDPKLKDEELRIMTEDIRTNQKRIVSLSKQIIIYTLGEQARERNITTAISEIRTWDSANVMLESYYNTGMFFACLPGNASETVRWIPMPSDVATAYLDFSTSFNGANKGDYVADRFGNLVHINLFNRDINNQNCLVIGPSGSGKSFTIGHFLLQRFERRERQIIIDVGGTYKNIFEALGSEDLNSGVKYYEYDPERPISFNPFLVPFEDNKYVLNEDKVDFILSLFSQLWSGKDLKKSVKAIISEWMELFYKEAVEYKAKDKAYIPTLKSFYDWLIIYNENNKSNSKHQSHIIAFNDAGLLDGFNDFIIVLTAYTTGKYKTLLNNNERLDISEYPLVCFDMARVKDNKELYPLVTMLLTELSMDVVRKYPNDIKHFVMDEAWSMLSEGMGSFVEYMYRTLRKNNGAMTIITQGITEIVESKVGSAIINNAATQIILNHTDINKIEHLSKHLGFTFDEVSKVASLRKGQTAREIFIKQGAESDVFSLEVCSSEHAILTSNPIERNHLNKLKQNYDKLAFAINQWVEDQKKGVFNNK